VLSPSRRAPANQPSRGRWARVLRDLGVDHDVGELKPAAWTQDAVDLGEPSARDEPPGRLRRRGRALRRDQARGLGGGRGCDGRAHDPPVPAVALTGAGAAGSRGSRVQKAKTQGPAPATRTSHQGLPDATPSRRRNTRRMTSPPLSVTVDARAMDVVESTIPADMTIRDWRARRSTPARRRSSRRPRARTREQSRAGLDTPKERAKGAVERPSRHSVTRS
jgi:hypothetical protein